jgi:hypothetical protein
MPEQNEQSIPDQYGKRGRRPIDPERDIFEIGKMAASAVDASTLKLIEDAKKAADAAEEIARMIRHYVNELENAYKSHSAELVERVMAFAQVNKIVQTSLIGHAEAINKLSGPIEEVRAPGEEERLKQLAENIETKTAATTPK